MTYKVLAVVGTRPQYIKHAAIHRSWVKTSQGIELSWMDTGQHYDDEMSAHLITELELPTPINILSGAKAVDAARQIAQFIKGVAETIDELKPNLLIVYGDTSSTLAAAIAANKMCVPLAHIEAGLRSHNLSMPEEINRIVTDRLAQLRFVPNEQAIKNLAAEGISSRVVNTGDIMYDIVTAQDTGEAISTDYYYMSLHRPYNVDDKARLQEILNAVNDLDYPTRFTVHPRTLKSLKAFEIDLDKYDQISPMEPLGFRDHIRHIRSAKAILTDSGGLQKEAYWCRTPCITIRSETEWNETLLGNWNQLIFNDLSLLRSMIDTIPVEDKYVDRLYAQEPAAERIWSEIIGYLDSGAWA